MKVKFNVENPTEYQCSEPVEQKIFRNGTPAGWILLFNIFGQVSGTELETLLTPEAIGELTFIHSDDTEETITGYNVVSACRIRHGDTETVTELQFTKGV